MPRFTGAVLRMAAACGLLLTVASFTTTQAASAAQNTEVVIALDEVGGSGVSGFATLVSGDGTTTVIVEVSGAVGDHPANVYVGSCDDLPDLPAYVLANVDETGYSETTIAIDIDTLLAGSYAINIDASPANTATDVACGNIVDLALTTTAVTEADVTLSEVDGSGYSGIASLLAEDGATTVLLTADVALGDESVGIYGGICSDLDLDPTYDLGILDASGILEVAAPVALADLLAGEFSLAVTDPFSGAVLACGEIVSDASTSTAGPSTGAGLPREARGPIALIIAAAFAATVGASALALRRSAAPH